MIEAQLAPCPQEIRLLGASVPRPRSAHIKLAGAPRSTSEFRPPDSELAEPAQRDAARLADDLLDIAGVRTTLGGRGEEGSLPIVMRVDGSGQTSASSVEPRAEGYRLRVAPEGVELVGADAAGLFYGGQTLLQVLALSKADDGGVEAVEIADRPHYAVRELMLDLGRAPHTMPLMKRAVRIMARLKLNSLHLHLNDDELNGLRLAKLPIGSENPWAMTLEDLRQLVAYARQYHVTVVPEIEAWGHAGSICYHYPELVGGPGMWGGFSFGLGEELYALMEKFLDEVMPVLEKDCYVHWGLDEAIWATAASVPQDRKNDYSPERHVKRLYEVLQRVASRHGRRAKMRIWADHGGRPIPEDIRDEVIVEPWMYLECREERIVNKVAEYGGPGKPPFMLGAGMSSQHHHGTYGATRVWCQAARDCPNVAGVDICLWESNDLASHMVGVYGGADYAWTPMTPAVGEKDNRLREHERGQMVERMKRWQAAFPDADETAIRLDMGFEAGSGRFKNGPLAGRPVAPTCEMTSPPRPEEGFGE